MFQVERLQKIRQILIAKKSVSVMDLSDVLDVSEITIRRDFEKLENDGFLQRTHGGAILNPDYQKDRARESISRHAGELELPLTELSAADEELGRQCLGIVEPYDILFLGRCPSNIALTRLLSEKNEIVVLTNSIEIMLNMQVDKKHRVILTGGALDYDRWVLQKSGDYNTFPDIRVNRAFLHVQGVDFSDGITMNDYEDVRIYKHLKSCITGDIVLVAEGSLFGRVGLHRADELSEVTAMVTDSRIPNEYKSWLYRRGVKLYQKFDL